jgi:hypothetical protein
MKKLPFGGKPVRFSKNVKSTIFIRFAYRPDTFNTEKCVLGGHIDLTASLYATKGAKTVCMRDSLVDEEHRFKFDEADAFTSEPAEYALKKVQGVLTSAVKVPGDIKTQRLIAEHIAGLVEYVKKEMSPERIRKIAKG